MAALDSFLAADSPLAYRLDAFAPRPAQLLMAEAVAEAMERRETLVVEAGTGTGKTFAYLLPVLLGGRRTIVSTGTRALQDQLYHRDLPLLAEASGAPLDVALLKGRSNYICHHRLAVAGEHVDDARSARDLDEVRGWAASTRVGDRRELVSVGEDSRVWPWVTSTIDNCIGQDCAFYDRCFVVKARRAAARADLVVINHHLLFADLAMKESGFDEFLPGADAMIIDEAHQLPDLASQFFGTSFGTRRAAMLLDEIDVTAGTAGGPPIRQATERARTALLKLREAAPRAPGRYADEHVVAALGEPLRRVRSALADVYDHLLPLSELGAEFESLAGRCYRSLEALIAIDDETAADGFRWLETGPRSATLNVMPLDVSDSVGALVRASDAAWVLTSATLALGDDFSHFTDRLGLDAARTLRLESPYDLEARCLVYLPAGLPAPSAAEHPARVVETAAGVAARTAGGLFVLFTSHRALSAAIGALDGQPRLFDDRPVFWQGSAPRDELLNRFRRAGNAVLLATGTYWEGVDVRGSALSAVVIDKLPFASPHDPLVQARVRYLQRESRNPFMEHQLPQAVLALKQGAGRLLRDADDAGVIALCDPRVTQRRYGRLFLDALKPSPVTASLDDVAEFFERHELAPAPGPVPA